MKPTLLIAILALTATTTLSAAAATTDRRYYVTELAPQQKFDVYNDGQNTYLESIPGLVVTGATADGERYIVNGVPQQIRGFINGKPITVMRGLPPLPKPPSPDPAAVSAQIKQLTEKLESLSSQVQPKTLQALAAPGVAGASVAAPSNTATPAAGTRIAPGDHLGRAPTINDTLTYRVSRNDENLRLLVDRWAKMVGWTAIWDVEKDILISTSGEKISDFKTTVRWLLTSTEFGDLVVKPCFYNNSVVRVVRKTVKCNPKE